MTSLDTLNALPQDEFVTHLAGIFEHSPWVAERAAAGRPYASRTRLLEAMRAVVATASPAEQMALILAHPKLGARGRVRAQLTPESAGEQKRAGLDACTDEQFAELLGLNERYMAKFGFPFILAVRGHDPQSILANMRARLDNDPPAEHGAALEQIGRIAGFRLHDAVSES